MSDNSRVISLLCPICGYDQFESLDGRYPDPDEAPDETMLKCGDCGATFTKEELFQENSERIEIAFEEMAETVLDEIEKDFEKELKKWKL